MGDFRETARQVEGAGPGFCPWLCWATSDESLSLSEPRSPHLYKSNNDTLLLHGLSPCSEVMLDGQDTVLIKG